MGDEFNYILCANCGCLQIEKAPDDMSKYYPRGYYSFRGPSEKEAIIKKCCVNVVTAMPFLEAEY